MQQSPKTFILPKINVLSSHNTTYLVNKVMADTIISFLSDFEDLIVFKNFNSSYFIDMFSNNLSETTFTIMFSTLMDDTNRGASALLRIYIHESLKVFYRSVFHLSKHALISEKKEIVD